MDKIHTKKSWIIKRLFWLFYLHFPIFFFSRERIGKKMEKDWVESIKRCQDFPCQLPHGEVPLRPMTSADSPSTPVFPISLHSLILSLSVLLSVDEKLNKYVQNRNAAVCIHIAVEAFFCRQFWYTYTKKHIEKSHRYTALEQFQTHWSTRKDKQLSFSQTNFTSCINRLGQSQYLKLRRAATS